MKMLKSTICAFLFTTSLTAQQTNTGCCDVQPNPVVMRVAILMQQVTMAQARMQQQQNEIKDTFFQSLDTVYNETNIVLDEAQKIGPFYRRLYKDMISSVINIVDNFEELYSCTTVKELFGHESIDQFYKLICAYKQESDSIYKEWFKKHDLPFYKKVEVNSEKNDVLLKEFIKGLNVPENDVFLSCKPPFTEDIKGKVALLKQGLRQMLTLGDNKFDFGAIQEQLKKLHEMENKKGNPVFMRENARLAVIFIRDLLVSVADEMVAVLEPLSNNPQSKVIWNQFKDNINEVLVLINDDAWFNKLDDASRDNFELFFQQVARSILAKNTH